jgi:hypothetical protein
MPMSNALKEKIYGSMTLQERFNSIVAQSTQATVPEAVKQILDALAPAIAEAKLQGLNYAVAMSLREGVDFVEPSRIERYRNKKPKVEILREAAKVIFDYCRDNGLQPEFSPYEKGADGKLTSEISIQWSPNQLNDCPSRDAVDVSFLQGLKDLHASVNQPRQVILRSRRSGAFEMMPKVIRDIERAVLLGTRSFLVHSEVVWAPHDWNRIYLYKSKTPDVIIDLKAFCELLGLTATMEKVWMHRTYRDGPYDRFDLTVSGWAAS